MAQFVKTKEMSRYEGMLNELLAVESGLTEWEIDFLDTLANWDGCFTGPQAETLEKIWNRIFG